MLVGKSSGIVHPPSKHQNPLPAMANKKKSSGCSKTWIPTSELAIEIGITAKTLLRQRGNYQEGVHYFNMNPFGPRPTYRWHKPKMLKAFSIKS